MSTPQYLYLTVAVVLKFGAVVLRQARDLVASSCWTTIIDQDLFSRLTINPNFNMASGINELKHADGVVMYVCFQFDVGTPSGVGIIKC
jgi:hypothetical protein